MINSVIAAERLTSFRLYTSEEEEKEQRLGVCTKLGLQPYDPWTIRKTLFASDVDSSSRLLLRKDDVDNYVLPYMGKDDVEKLFGSICKNDRDHASDKEGESGVKVKVVDLDTDLSEHQLVLKRWSSTGSFVLTSNWPKEFVIRRGLEKGDEIGLFWDKWNACFWFKKAPPKPN